MRQVTGVRVSFRRDAHARLTARPVLVLHVDGVEHPLERVPEQAYRAMEVRSRQEPVRYGTVHGLEYWRHQDSWWSVPAGAAAGAPHQDGATALTAR